MKKILLYPLWKADELENRLHNFELDGWKLKSVSYSYIFNFVEAKTKNSDYIITYNMAKDNTPCMYEWEQMLLNDYSADKIQTKMTGYNIFRVTADNREFNDLKDYRKSYFKHVLFQYMLISAIFLTLGVCSYIRCLFAFSGGVTTNINYISLYLYFHISIIFFI